MATAEAFRTFAIEPPYQVRSMRVWIQKRKAELGQQIVDGYAHDWPDYRHRVGMIAGLKECEMFCDEMEKAERT